MQYSQDEKRDYIKVEDKFYTHKQIELRNGIIYMRMKKRLIKANE